MVVPIEEQRPIERKVKTGGIAFGCLTWLTRRSLDGDDRVKLDWMSKFGLGVEGSPLLAAPPLSYSTKQPSFGASAALCLL